MIHEMNDLLKNSGIKLSFNEFLKVYIDNYFEIRKAFDFDNLSNVSEF